MPQNDTENRPPRRPKHRHKWRHTANTDSHLGEIEVIGCLVNGCTALRAQYVSGRLTNEEADFTANGDDLPDEKDETPHRRFARVG